MVALKQTQSFGNKGPDTEKKSGIFQFVNKTGPNLKNRLVKVKNLALGPKNGCTTPCSSRNCQCCKIISPNEEFSINNQLVRSSPGSCATYNIIYMVVCKCCNKAYIGRSVRALRTRIGEHRRAYYNILNNKTWDPEDDDYAMGIHLAQDHGFDQKSDFEDNFEICIVDICSPKIIDRKEHEYIHRLRTLRPLGMNSQNPFAIPLLDP